VVLEKDFHLMTLSTNLPEGPVIYEHAGLTEPMSWVHLNRHNPKTVDHLKGVDPLVRDALLQEDTRPRTTQFEDGLLIILRGVNYNEGAQPEDMVAVRVWATQTSVTTLAAWNIRAINDLDDLYQEGKGPNTPGAFIAFLASRLVERITPVVIQLDDDADSLEERMESDDSSSLAKEASKLRHAILSLRRYLLPQREAVAALLRDSAGLLSDKDIFLLRETMDDLLRINESLDTIRERLNVIYEQLAERRSTAMNDRLFVLAIVSAVFLPLSFFTGLLGVNVGGIPGADSNIAFALLCVIMALVAVGLLVIFRRLKWL
jgi:zinc transporter